MPLVAHWRGRIVMLLMISVLTGCPVANGTPTAAPVTGSHSAGPTSSPQIGGPAESSNASLSAPSILGAGSFPRSFPDPGDRNVDPHRRFLIGGLTLASPRALSSSAASDSYCALVRRSAPGGSGRTMGHVGPETCRQQRRAPSSRTASACRRFRSVEFAGATRPYITYPLPQEIRQRAVILAAAMRAKMGRTMMTRGSAPRPSSWLLWASGLMLFAAGCAAPPAMPEASVPAPPVPSGQARI